MNKLLTKTIAVLVVFVMVFQLFPNIVFGIQKEKIIEAQQAYLEPEEIQEEIQQTNEQEEVTIIGEDTERRTLNEKHYLLSNGSTIAAIYPNNVHYEKDGALIDIDNTIVKTQNEEEYTNKNNIFKVNFPKQVKDGKKVKIEQGKYAISWDILEQNKKMANKTQIQIEAEKRNIQSAINENIIGKEFNQNKTSEARILQNKIVTKKQEKQIKQNKMELDKINSAIKYNEVIPGIDVQYDISSTKLKESIIIRNKNQLQEEFIFSITTKELKANLKHDKTITLVDKTTDKEIFTIEAPYMYDGKLEFSNEIEVDLKETENRI